MRRASLKILLGLLTLRRLLRLLIAGSGFRLCWLWLLLTLLALALLRLLRLLALLGPLRLLTLLALALL